MDPVGLGVTLRKYGKAKHFNLMGTFVSYEDNKGLLVRPQFHIQLIELFWKCEKILFLSSIVEIFFMSVVDKGV